MTELRILDFDIENRPLSYLGQDFTTAEITAICACYIGEPKTMKTWLLGRDPSMVMLGGFAYMYDNADMVTGHYIRAHDLPVINGALLEHGFAGLGEKLTSCTKTDLLKRKYISVSQESLAGLLGIKANKVHMTQAQWREANRLTEKGLKLTEKRVKGDVLQHMEMRKALIARGWLGPARVWRP